MLAPHRIAVPKKAGTVISPPGGVRVTASAADGSMLGLSLPRSSFGSTRTCTRIDRQPGPAARTPPSERLPGTARPAGLHRPGEHWQQVRTARMGGRRDAVQGSAVPPCRGPSSGLARPGSDGALRLRDARLSSSCPNRVLEKRRGALGQPSQGQAHSCPGDLAAGVGRGRAWAIALWGRQAEPGIWSQDAITA